MLAFNLVRSPLVALLFASVAMAVPQSCRPSSSTAGLCLTTKACKSHHGTSHPQNLCPGSQDIQCCTMPTSKTAGHCLPKGLCAGKVGASCGEGSYAYCTSIPANLPTLDLTKSAHARGIFAGVEAKAGKSKQACAAAISTSLTEGGMQNYASSVVSSSKNYQHDAIGSDHDSVGLFQQRVAYYPNVASDMSPKLAAEQFIAKVLKIKGWKTMDVGRLDQKVQVSAYPDRYEKNVAQAHKICAAGGFTK